MISKTISSVSGQHVFVESGLHVDISGQPVDISGQRVYVESGVHVISDIEVEVSSGLYVMANVEGIDYIKSGTFPACSGTHGQLETPTVMKAHEPAHPISGWWACAEESRLFVGSDDKHIRFHDTFQATGLDGRKWETVTGTPTVANGYCALVNADIDSREKVLYGILSVTVWSSNYQNVAFGFGTTNYPQGGDSIVDFNGGSFRTENVGTNTTTSTDVPAADLEDAVWYDIDIVWTPSYAQFWVNGQLKVTHTTNIPSSPANIFFSATQGILYVANVSLKPYGDIPLTHRGAIPIAGGYYRDSGLLNMEFRPLRVCESGEIVICSGVHVVADVAVEVSSGLWVDGVSGVHVYVESGAFVTVAAAVIVGSGVIEVESGLGVLISGQHVYVESGVWVAGVSLSGLDIQVNISGDPVSISGQPVDITSGAIVVDSGLHVWISGQHVYQESGAFVTAHGGIQVSGTMGVSGTVDIASGTIVVDSGLHVWISGQHVYQESGAFVTADIGSSGVVSMSGNIISISGEILVGITSGLVAIQSGTINYIASGAVVVDSGLHVWISGQHVYQESGAFVTAYGGIQVSGTMGVSGTVDIASGAIVVDSGLHVWISGQHVYVESGVYLASGAHVETEIPIIVKTTCFRLFPSISGGIVLHSGSIRAVVVRALSTNSGDVYLGGDASPYYPYSGCGFQLEPGDALNIDIDNFDKIYGMAEVSGDSVTYIGVL